MNNQRRTQIIKVVEAIREEVAKDILNRDIINMLINELDMYVEEERFALDNYPESLQETDRWEEYDDNCEELSDIVMELNDNMCEDDDDDVKVGLNDALEDIEFYL